MRLQHIMNNKIQKYKKLNCHLLSLQEQKQGLVHDRSLHIAPPGPPTVGGPLRPPAGLTHRSTPTFTPFKGPVPPPPQGAWEGTLKTCYLFSLPFAVAGIKRNLASMVAQIVKNLPAMQGTQVQSLVQSMGQEDPVEKGMATHSSMLPWRIPWTEERDGYSPQGRKESDKTE